MVAIRRRSGRPSRRVLLGLIALAVTVPIAVQFSSTEDAPSTRVRGLGTGGGLATAPSSGLESGKPKGFADLHAHPSSHLAFGHRGGPCTEGLFHGSPGEQFVWDPAAPEDAWASDIAHDLASCDPGDHSRCPEPPPPHGEVRSQTRAALLSNIEARWPWPHGPHGAPSYKSWPNANSVTHQQMHLAWLHKAYRSGMRLMIASVADNELLERLYHHSGLCDPGGVFRPDPDFAFTSAVEQIKFLWELDAKNEWFEVVTDPSQAWAALDADRLAVILGVEMDFLTLDHIKTLVEDYDVRSVIPIHLIDNELGGTAVFEDTFNALNGWQHGDFFRVREDPSLSFRLRRPQRLAQEPTVLCPLTPHCCALTPKEIEDREFGALGYGSPLTVEGHANELGLRDVDGMRSLMENSHGLLLDVAHMSWRATEETLELAEKYGFPLINSHTGIRGGCEGERHTSERDLTHDHLARIARLGGVVGLGTVAEPPAAALVSTFGWPAQRFTGHTSSWRLYRQPHDRAPRDPNTRLEALTVRVKTGLDGLADEFGRCAAPRAVLTLRTTGGNVSTPLNGDGGSGTVPIPWGSLLEVPWDLSATRLGPVRVGDILGFELDLQELERCRDGWAVEAVAVEYTTLRGAARGLLVERVGGPYGTLGISGRPLAFGLDRHHLANPDWRDLAVASIDIDLSMGSDALDSDLFLGIQTRHDPRPSKIRLNDWLAPSDFSRRPDQQATGTVEMPAGIAYGDIVALWVESGDDRSDVHNDHGDVARFAAHWTDTRGNRRPLADFSSDDLRGDPAFRIDSVHTTLVFRGLDEPIDAATPISVLGAQIWTGGDNLEEPVDVVLLGVDGSTRTVANINQGQNWGTGFTEVPKAFVPPGSGVPPHMTVGDLMGVEIRTAPGGGDNWNVDGIVIQNLTDPAAPWVGEFLKAHEVMSWSGQEPGIALGTDFNGLSPQMPFAEPRGDKDSPDLHELPTGYRVARGDRSTGKEFRLERDGIAHYGLLPDFVANAITAERDVFSTSRVRSTLYGSAAATIAAWERAVAASERVRKGAAVDPPPETPFCRVDRRKR